MKKDIPDFSALVEAGNFTPIIGWLKDHIWSYGRSITGPELMQRLTGGSLDAEPFLAYLNEKYGHLYGF